MLEAQSRPSDLQASHDRAPSPPEDHPRSVSLSSPASVWVKADRLHTLIPRETARWKKLYRGGFGVEQGVRTPEARMGHAAPSGAEDRAGAAPRRPDDPASGGRGARQGPSCSPHGVAAATPLAAGARWRCDPPFSRHMGWRYPSYPAPKGLDVRLSLCHRPVIGARPVQVVARLVLFDLAVLGPPRDSSATRDSLPLRTRPGRLAW